MSPASRVALDGRGRGRLMFRCAPLDLEGGGGPHWKAGMGEVAVLDGGSRLIVGVGLVAQWGNYLIVF